MEETHLETPKKYLLDDSLDKINNILRWLGLPLGKKARSLQSFWMYYCNFVMLNLLVLGAMSWFADGVSKGESLTSLTSVAPCFTMSLMADMKCISLIVYRENLSSIIGIMGSLEREGMKRLTAEKDEMITREIKSLNRVLKVMYYINWSLFVSYSTMPVVLMYLNYMKTEEINLLMPILIKYPFDELNMKLYPFVYLNQMWSVITVVFQVYCADSIYYISCAHIKIHFRLLAYDLRDLVDMKVTGILCDSPAFKRRFDALMKRHRKIIHVSEQLELMYCKSTLFNFSTSSALICLTFFNVTNMEDVAFVVIFVSFLFVTLLQIYLLCYFGEIIMNSSKDISNSIYNSNWYMTDAKSAKLLFIVLIRSQKPCRLTAYGFAEINLRAFMKILSTAWSYFALLQTVYTPGEGK